MMVIHKDSERPVEIAVIRKSLLEKKSYLIVKNHVKELSNTAKNTTNTNRDDKKSLESSENQETMKKKPKSLKRPKENEKVPMTSSDYNNVDQSATEIDASDLNELKTVYIKCKEVMSRIETKYGHLLNLDCEEGTSRRYLKRNFISETFEDECNCKTKKKIVFDDEGRQSTVDISDKHICVKTAKNVPSTTNSSINIAVEYQNAELGLPESLHELRKMLHDPDIENTYRNKVIHKIKLLKEEYNNDIKFNKHILIEKLKSNPNEVLDFKGTNLSTIPGYS